MRLNLPKEEDTFQPRPIAWCKESHSESSLKMTTPIGFQNQVFQIHSEPVLIFLVEV